MSVSQQRRRIRNEQRYYQRLRHRQDTKIYYHILGLRGVLAFWSNLVSGHPELVTVSPKEVRHPLSLRLRTTDAKVYKGVFLRKDYDYPTVFSPRTIVDAGANCGMTSIFYANQYPEATIVAVEPEISNYTALARNTRAYPNIIPIHAALWNEDGQVEVVPGDLGFSRYPRMMGWGKWAFHVRKGTGCRALTMATLMREVGIETVDILKVDVEGAEWEIFSNCNWIDMVKLLAIELHDRARPGCSDVVNSVARNFQKTERGAVTFYSR